MTLQPRKTNDNTHDTHPTAFQGYDDAPISKSCNSIHRCTLARAQSVAALGKRRSETLIEILAMRVVCGRTRFGCSCVGGVASWANQACGRSARQIFRGANLHPKKSYRLPREFPSATSPAWPRAARRRSFWSTGPDATRARPSAGCPARAGRPLMRCASCSPISSRGSIRSAPWR